MREYNKRALKIRTELENLSETTGTDTTTDVVALAQIARDAYESGKTEEYKSILASIPPVKLGRTSYRVAAGCGMVGVLCLIGPRGGDSTLVQNIKNPKLWAHNQGVNKTTWYKRSDNGTFEAF